MSMNSSGCFAKYRYFTNVFWYKATASFTICRALASYKLLVTEVVKTASGDITVTYNFVELHVRLGTVSLNQRINKGNAFEHLRF